MTSQQLIARRHNAISIIAECERFFDEFDRCKDTSKGVALRHRVVDFMAAYRQTIATGGTE